MKNLNWTFISTWLVIIAVVAFFWHYVFASLAGDHSVSDGGHAIYKSNGKTCEVSQIQGDEFAQVWLCK